MSDELTEPQMRAIENLVKSGKTLDAIKLHHHYTGSSLMSSKAYIDQLAEKHDLAPEDMQTGTIRVQREADPNDPNEGWALIEGNLYLGKRIEAIKIAREQFGVGLKEARDMVTKHEQLLQQRHPDQFLSSKSGCRFGGCTVRMSIFLLGAGAAGWLILSSAS